MVGHLFQRPVDVCRAKKAGWGFLQERPKQFDRSDADSPSPGKRFLHSGTQKIADHLSERLIFFGVQVLRDVTQNVAFAVVILDKDWAKE
jgi:hypothetical protein